MIAAVLQMRNLLEWVFMFGVWSVEKASPKQMIMVQETPSARWKVSTTYRLVIPAPKVVFETAKSRPEAQRYR